MKLGQWFSSHPPLSRRLAALLELPVKGTHRATLGAAGIVLLGIGVPAIGGVVFVQYLGPQMQAALRPPAAAAPAPAADGRRRQVEEGILSLAQTAETARAQAILPADGEGLYALWRQSHPQQSEPRDPYTGERYAYETAAGHYRIWSPGPDRRSTEDDLYYDSRPAAR